MNRNRKSQQTSLKGKRRLQPRPVLNSYFPKDIPRWYPLLLIVITLGVFSQNVSHQFTYDDQKAVLNDPRIWQWDIEAFVFPHGEIYWGLVVRPLTYMVDYSLFGLSPGGYHLHNLFWHSLCVVCVFFFLKKLTQEPTSSFFGALIFAIHPIHVEAVSNITNRKELLALAFLLIAFLCYIRFLEGTTSGKWGWFSVGVLAWGIGLLSKQIAIVLPPLLVVYEFLLVPKDQRFLTKNIPLLVGIFGIGSLPLLMYALYVLDITDFQTSISLSYTLKGYRGDLTYLALIATSARAFWTYLQLLVWPSGLCPNHLIDLSPSLLDVKALLAWSGLIAFVMIMLRLSTRWPVLAFGMFWFFISYIPISNWVPSSYILADRYMYMPSVGYCIILAALGQRLYKWLVTTSPRRAAGISSLFAIALTIGYASTTLAYNQHWSNQKALMDYMLQCNPLSPQAYNGLGIYYLKLGEYAKAVEHFSQSIRLGQSSSYNNRGNAYYHLKQYQAALEDYNQAMALKPHWGDPYNNRGTLFYELGKYQAALKDYQQAITLNPYWGEPYFNLGILYLAQKKYAQAIEDFTKALNKMGDQSRVFNARGLAYEKLDNWTKAQEDYAKAIASDPSNGEAFFNLGRVQLHNDELEAAILSYQKSKDLGWEKADDVLKVLRKKGYLQ
ncbi:MAG: tetratricopeptide repeat protein [Nitrospirales bacterium]|nr:tetratricopeptide repeat protein [Nitrospirales bacterium]